MVRLTIVIPVYNEEYQLKTKIAVLQQWKKSFSDELEILIFDSNSNDQSSIYLTLLQTEKIASVYFLNQSLHPERSIGRALTEACQKATGEMILILPIDVAISVDQINQVIQADSATFIWGAFFKKYDSGNQLMKIYGYLQNQILGKILKQVVWTNVFFFKKSIAQYIPELGFLEDLIFCDRLNKLAPPLLIENPVVVNSRKYQKDGLSRRIFFNGLILILFRCGYSDLQTLKYFYAGKINLFDLVKKILKIA